MFRELLLIRHATTDLAGTLCGQLDPPLNAIGQAQAAAIVPLLRNRKICRLYASDLRRAVETALPIAELCKLSILARSDLREMSFGAWEGKRWSDIMASRDKQATRAFKLSPEIRAPGGESFASFRVRAGRALKEVVTSSVGYSTAVVTHMGVIRVALQELSIPPYGSQPEGRIENCAIYRFLTNGISWRFTGQLTAEQAAQSKQNP